MKKWIAAVIAMFSVAVLAPAPPAQATTNLQASFAIMSTITSCGGVNDWRATFHLYSTFDGGQMWIQNSNWPGWNHQWGTRISSDGLFTISFILSDSKTAAYVSATIGIQQTVWPGGTVYRSAAATAKKPNC